MFAFKAETRLLYIRPAAVVVGINTPNIGSEKPWKVGCPGEIPMLCIGISYNYKV